MPWLVLAGLVEGFVTGTYSLAVVLPRRDRARRVYWGLVFTLGRDPERGRSGLALLRPRVRADARAREALGRASTTIAPAARTRWAASARAARISSATVIA